MATGYGGGAMILNTARRRRIFWAAAAIVAVWWLRSQAARAAVTVGDLRCEYLRDPQGIDVARPRLSWILNSKERGERQTAYQVIAASSPEELQADKGDLWDSGKVESDQSILVPYGGKELGPHASCIWKVRAWDAAGEASRWSRPASWTTGLMAPEDWKAQWIGLDGEDKGNSLTDSHWIWFAEGNPAKAAPPGTRFFRRVFTAPAGREVKKATCKIAADNGCMVYLNGQEIGSHNTFQWAKEIDLTPRMIAGENVLAVRAVNDGTGPNPAGLVARLQIDFKSGDPMVVTTDDHWKASDKKDERWAGADFDDLSWTAAKDLGPVGMPPWNEVRTADARRLPARYLRKDFSLAKDVRRATVYFSGLGLSELYINGKKAGDHVLSPALSEYNKRAFYVTFDVTDRLRQGANALGVILGNGRFYGPRSPPGTRSYGFPKLLLHLRIEHEGGTVSDIVSDGSWKASADGPILANNEYDGEEYDARKELGDWAAPKFDDSKWQAAQVVQAPTDNVVAEMIDPIRVTETIKPVAVTERRPGVFIFDMGQNMVGWCRLKVTGTAGTQVKLRHAETLQADGSLYVANLRDAKVTDVYTLRGGGEETWEPRFTYHGFRFVEVTGYPGKPPLEALEGRLVHDDLERTGHFECSNPLLNSIYENIVRGVQSNYRSISTDCPQRDERQGWLGDRSEESRGEAYLFDNAALYSKWLGDMADAQKDSGSVPDVCPSYWPLYSDNVTWPSSSVIIPNSLYRQFGDAGIVARHFDSAKKWLDYMHGFVKDGIIERDSYGDWCVPPEDAALIHSKDPARQTAKALLATSYLAYDYQLMERYARLLGKKEDAEQWGKLAADTKAAFNAKFLDREKGQYDNGTQTSCVLPLAFGLAPGDMRDRIIAHLVHKITDETHGHIGTGLVGGQFLNRVLSDNGRADLSYTMASQKDYPSWGYMVAKGATTVWELWNGDTADPAMNSGNHVMLVGDLVIWLYEYVAGIRPDEDRPGFKHIIMRPEPVGDLTFVKASLRSPYGMVASYWQKKDGAFDWQIAVPANATATVYVPAKSADAVTEGGSPASGAKGVKLRGEEAGRAVFEIGGGEYHFVSKP